jgi:cold shock CspA family protein
MAKIGFGFKPDNGGPDIFVPISFPPGALPDLQRMKL